MRAALELGAGTRPPPGSSRSGTSRIDGALSGVPPRRRISSAISAARRLSKESTVRPSRPRRSGGRRIRRPAWRQSDAPTRRCRRVGRSCRVRGSTFCGADSLLTLAIIFRSYDHEQTSYADREADGHGRGANAGALPVRRRGPRGVPGRRLRAPAARPALRARAGGAVRYLGRRDQRRADRRRQVAARDDALLERHRRRSAGGRPARCSSSRSCAPCCAWARRSCACGCRRRAGRCGRSCAAPSTTCRRSAAARWRCRSSTCSRRASSCVSKLLEGIQEPFLADTARLRARLVDELGGEVVPHDGRRLAINTVDAHTGQVVRYVTTRTRLTRPPDYIVVDAITVDMIMASFSIPLLFPTVEIDGRWLWDGGLLVNTPLAPVVALGADEIVTVLVTEPPDVTSGPLPALRPRRRAHRRCDPRERLQRRPQAAARPQPPGPSREQPVPRGDAVRRGAAGARRQLQRRLVPLLRARRAGGHARRRSARRRRLARRRPARRPPRAAPAPARPRSRARRASDGRVGGRAGGDGQVPGAGRGEDAPGRAGRSRRGRARSTAPSWPISRDALGVGAVAARVGGDAAGRRPRARSSARAAADRSGGRRSRRAHARAASRACSARAPRAW